MRADQAANATVSGVVIDQSNGLPLGNADVVLFFDERKASQTTSDPQGRFTFSGEAPGSYYVEVRESGYTPTRSDTLFVVPGTSHVAATVTVARATTSQPLRDIGHVIVGGRSELQTSTTIHSDFDGKLLQRENFVRVGDALNTLPGVNLSSQSSAVGDDIYVNLRGIGATETATLLDGHPIGPVGVAPGTFFNGVPTAFDYQDTPGFALRNIEAVYGSGALGLYGTDSIGGTIDLQTLLPTIKPELELTQGIGNYGKSSTSFRLSGSALGNHRLGYVLLDAVQGTYGNFAPQQIVQTGLSGTNFTPSTLAGNTYLVSGAYLLRNDLAKLRYDLSPATQLTLTGYTGTSWDDKSGNGDNDFLTYDQQLYNGQSTIAGGGSTLTGTDASGASVVTYSCQAGTPGPNGSPTVAGIAVTTPSGTNACYTAAQFAAASSGPAGGGPSPYQAIRNQDYHLRLTSRLGINNLVLDGYVDNYALDYNRNIAGGLGGPTGKIFVGGFDTSIDRTNGLLLSDDIVLANNDIGFGYFALHQTATGDTYNTSTFRLDPNQTLPLQESNYFIRDAYTPSNAVNVFVNAWLKHTTVTNETKFDPRVSLVLRPTSRDVVRLTAGSSTSAPVPSLRAGTSNLNQTPQNITPTCNGSTAASVGAAGNPNVASETGSGQEISVGHTFFGDSNIQLSAYNENVFGKIFNNSEPVSVLGTSAIPASLLAAYVSRIQQFCPNYSGLSAAQIIPLLAVSTPINAAIGKYRGIELSGRYRFNRNFYTDYTYDVQSAALTGVPDSILMHNQTLVPGAQVLGIPLHKASVGLDVVNNSGFEARLDTYYVGANNGFNRPEYFYSNATVSQRFGKSTTLNLGVFNAFNSATDTYGRIGLGVFAGQNKFGTSKNAFDQGSERFALPPTQIQLTVSTKLF